MFTCLHTKNNPNGIVCLYMCLQHYTTHTFSDSARHWSQDICLPISSNCPEEVKKNKLKISLFIKECHEEILIKLAIVVKISKSRWNTAHVIVSTFGIINQLINTGSSTWGKYSNL